jgi:hypothetical protein
MFCHLFPNGQNWRWFPDFAGLTAVFFGCSQNKSFESCRFLLQRRGETQEKAVAGRTPP